MSRDDEKRDAEIDKHFNKARKHLRSIFETDDFIRWLERSGTSSKKTIEAAKKAFRPNNDKVQTAINETKAKIQPIVDATNADISSTMGKVNKIIDDKE